MQFVQMKGKAWTDTEKTSGAPPVQGGGDKRQCTGMTATAASGAVLNGQMVSHIASVCTHTLRVKRC